MAEKTYYLGTLDRFGYTLTAVSTNKKTVKDIIMKEYIKTYIAWNHIDPRKDKTAYGETFYRSAVNDLQIIDINENKVEWM